MQRISWVFWGFGGSGYGISGCYHPALKVSSRFHGDIDHRQAPSDHFKDGRSVKSLVEDLYCKRVAVDADFLVLDGTWWGLGWCKIWADPAAEGAVGCSLDLANWLVRLEVVQNPGSTKPL